MPTIFDLVTPKAIASEWNKNYNERVPFLGEMFFGTKKQLGLDMKYIKGAEGSVKPLMLSAFDAKAIPIDRQGFEEIAQKMPFFKNSMNIDENDRQNLNMVINSGNQAYIDTILNKVYKDEMTLLERANITREIMRMQALTSGMVTFSSNGQTVAIDYKIPTANKVSLSSNKWSDSATADPISDITSWQDKIENATGVRPNRLLMNTNTFNRIKKCDSIKNAVYVFGQGKVTPTTKAVKDFILTETGCTVYIYNKGYTNSSGTFTKFIADEIVVLLPDTFVGDTWFGTTPEESDLMTGSNAQVQIVDTGVAITTTKETDPVNVATKVSMICLPSLEKANQILIATVHS